MTTQILYRKRQQLRTEPVVVASNRSIETLVEQFTALPTLSSPSVSPDGERLCFLEERDGQTALVVEHVETDRETVWRRDDELLTHRAAEWSADGERIYVHTNGEWAADIHAVAPDGTTDPVVQRQRVCVLMAVGERGGSLVFASPADEQLDLFRRDLRTGAVERLTDHEYAVAHATLSPDERRVAYSCRVPDRSGSATFVLDVDGGRPREVTVGERDGELAPADWHPDGRRLLVGDNSPDRPRSGVYDTDTESVTWLGDDQYVEEPVLFTPSGEEFLAVRSDGISELPVVYDLDTGDHRVLDYAPGVVEYPYQHGLCRCQTAAFGDRTLLVRHETATTRGRLTRYGLTDDTVEPLYEAGVGELDRDRLVEPRRLVCRSDGVPATSAWAVDQAPATEREIELLLYDAGSRPSPLVVVPHGGPRDRDRYRFAREAQFLSALGCSVLQVNYRGSSGRGRSFVESLYGRGGGPEQGDIATAVEYVTETRDWVDDDAVGIYGSMFGGDCAYWQAVQYPELYDAVAGWLGFSDLTRLYEKTLPAIRTENLERYFGTPTENPDRYRARSPITHAENVQSPTLLVHAQNERVPVSQATAFADRLAGLGHDTDSLTDVCLRELDAEQSQTAVRRRVLQTVGEFFTTNLR